MKKVVIYVGVYVVGIYVLQRFVTGPLPAIPGFLDPLGSFIGYPLKASS